MQTPPFDPAKYPSTYTASAGWRAFGLLGGGGLGIGGAAGIAYFGSGHEWHGAGAAWTACLTCLVFVALGVATIVCILRAQVTLAPSFIESRSLLTRRILRSDIVEYRVRVHDGVSEFRIRTRSSRRLFKFTPVFKIDADFSAWFADLKNPDLIAHEADLREIERDDTLGMTPALRLESAMKARATAGRLCLAGMVIAVWTSVYPHPYWPMIWLTALMPPLAVLLTWRFQGLFTLADKRMSARGNLAALMLIPPLVLPLRAFLDRQLIRPVEIVGPSVIAGIILLAMAVAASSEMRKNKLAVLAASPLFVIYAAAMLAMGNCGFDAAAPIREATVVTGMRHTSGKGASAYLTLAKVPVDLADHEVRVSFDLYHRTSIGSDVCVIDHPGAFGWRWIDIDTDAACRSS